MTGALRWPRRDGVVACPEIESVSVVPLSRFEGSVKFVNEICDHLEGGFHLALTIRKAVRRLLGSALRGKHIARLTRPGGTGSEEAQDRTTVRKPL